MAAGPPIDPAALEPVLSYGPAERAAGAAMVASGAMCDAFRRARELPPVIIEVEFDSGAKASGPAPDLIAVAYPGMDVAEAGYCANPAGQKVATKDFQGLVELVDAIEKVGGSPLKTALVAVGFAAAGAAIGVAGAHYFTR